MLRRRIIQAANDQGLEITDWLERALGPHMPPAENGLTEVLAAIDKCLADLGRGREPAEETAAYAADPASLPTIADDGAWGQVVSLEARRRRPR